ncbi:MAG TPA: hypothetical protein VG457_04970, partial [Planctomycetota bacterium]|nr:hypothetical protein [Planctomycetota bacterium]
MFVIWISSAGAPVVGFRFVAGNSTPSVWRMSRFPRSANCAPLAGTTAPWRMSDFLVFVVWISSAGAPVVSFRFVAGDC